MSVENNAFRHAPGCTHAYQGQPGRPDATDATNDVEHATEHDPLLRLSLGRSTSGRHIDIYRCRECAAKGPLDR